MSLHGRPEDEDINLEDSISGFIRFASSGSGLGMGELSLVPSKLDGFAGGRSSSAAGELPSLAWAVLLLAVVRARDAPGSYVGFCSNRAIFAWRSERYLSSISICSSR